MGQSDRSLTLIKNVNVELNVECYTKAAGGWGSQICRLASINKFLSYQGSRVSKCIPYSQITVVQYVSVPVHLF